VIRLLLVLAIQAEASSYYVELNWIQSRSPGITGNCIYRAKAGATLKKLACVEPPIIKYKDARVKDGVTYRYAVTALEGEEESHYSNKIIVKVPDN
jgi:fibronectin type 3 domain-containing protein